MSIITLISDWQNDDFYTGSVKGRLYSLCKGVNVIEITNKLPHNNITFAGFILKHCISTFPDGTIHIVAVKAACNKKNRFLIANYHNHIVLCADNGIIGLLNEEKPDSLYCIDNKYINNQEAFTFPELNLFTIIAGEIHKGIELSQIGSPTTLYEKPSTLLPYIQPSRIYGTVIYVDSYGNLISNVDRQTFERIGTNREFSIYLNSELEKIEKINKHYFETASGELLAIFNSLGLLEIAMRDGNISQLLQLRVNTSIRIDFK